VKGKGKGAFTSLAAALLFTVVATGSTLAADEPLEKGYELGEVVVSAHAGGVEAIGTVITITADDLRDSGARTLDDALELVPGVYVRTGAAGTPRLDIRGFRTRHVQLLFDGIPINDTFDGQFDPTTIPVEHIARIKVTTGGASVLYGPGGNGGVINIVTKAGLGKMQCSAIGEAGSGDTYLARVSLSTASDKARFYISSSPLTTDGYPVSGELNTTGSESGGQRDNSDRKRLHLFASAGFDLSDSTQVGVTFNRFQGEHGVPAVVNYDKNDPFTKKPKYDRVDDLTGYAVQAAMGHAGEGPVSVKGWVFLNSLDQEDNRYDDAGYDTQVANGARHTAATTRAVGVNLQLRYATPRSGAFTLGLGGEADRWEAVGFSVGKKDVRTDLDQAEAVQIYSAALQYEVTPASGLAMAAGLGHNIQTRTGADNASDFTYMLGGRYAFSPQTRIRASHARKVRFPSIRQLYDPTAGNTDLKAERSLHHEVGLEWDAARDVQVTAAAFLVNARDFIEKDETDLYRNFEDYRYRGLEIATRIQPTERLKVSTAYAYLHSENRSADSEREELQNRPGDKVSLEATYRFRFGIAAHASLLHVADQVFYDNDGKLPREKKNLDAFTLVDAKLSYGARQVGLQIYAGVDNLFDTNYEQSYGLPRPGRTYYVGAGHRF
jgi:vitamin B12 transporter